MDLPAIADLERADRIPSADASDAPLACAAGASHRPLLERSAVFQDMPASALDYLLAHASECALDAGGVLFFKHDPSSFVGVVVQGRLYKVLYGPDGQELIVGTIEPGGLVDEQALLEQHGRSFTAIAFGPSCVLKLTRRHFAALMAVPLFQQRIDALLRLRLRQTLDSLESICLHRLEVRLARYVLHQLELQAPHAGGGDTVALPPNQSILAAMLNASRSKLNVQLQRWVRSGLVSRRRHLLRVHDLGALYAKANLQGATAMSASPGEGTLARAACPSWTDRRTE
ncbi:Crp/Fnr family transcriptional regulator [Xanthomonas sp. NCPPB 1128]|uniref:Crp/Fnr family transcriptional regulator n=1 Tax=Xanthomonas sp. NCPPB 1128 TaxID=1775876 RepID=UPI0009E23AA9|nr:Crp/Fnr family transcriptional regulator [Xanthomonas sp. NCPPB 1128]